MNLGTDMVPFCCKYCNVLYQIIVSPDESTVMLPPPKRLPFGRDNFKNILVRPFKFGMWVYMGNATNAIVL